MKNISYERIKQIGLFIVKSTGVWGFSLFTERETHYAPFAQSQAIPENEMKFEEARRDSRQKHQDIFYKSRLALKDAV